MESLISIDIVRIICAITLNIIAIFSKLYTVAFTLNIV